MQFDYVTKFLRSTIIFRMSLIEVRYSEEFCQILSTSKENILRYCRLYTLPMKVNKRRAALFPNYACSASVHFPQPILFLKNPLAAYILVIKMVSVKSFSGRKLWVFFHVSSDHVRLRARKQSCQGNFSERRTLSQRNCIQPP